MSHPACQPQAHRSRDVPQGLDDNVLAFLRAEVPKHGDPRHGIGQLPARLERDLRDHEGDGRDQRQAAALKARRLECRVDDHAIEQPPGALPPVAAQPRQQRGIGHLIERSAPALTAGFKPMPIRQNIVGRGDDPRAVGHRLSEPAHPPWQAIQKRIRAAKETIFMLHVHEVWLQIPDRRNRIRSYIGGCL